MDFMEPDGGRFEVPEKEHVSLDDQQAFMLPQRVRQVKVLTGTARIVLGDEAVILRPKEALYLHHYRPGVVVTALGKQQLEFEMTE